MYRDDVLKVVTHTGDCYRVKTVHEKEPFNFYVSKVHRDGLEQDADAPEIPWQFIHFHSIEWIEAY